MAAAVCAARAGLLLPKLCKGVAREAAIADREVQIAADAVRLHHLHQRAQRAGRLASAHVAPARQACGTVGAILPAALGIHACEGHPSLQSSELHKQRFATEVG